MKTLIASLYERGRWERGPIIRDGRKDIIYWMDLGLFWCNDHHTDDARARWFKKDLEQ